MPRGAAEIEAAVRATGLLAPGRPVLVMYSGGCDSTCLLDLAVRISGAPDVRALHVNYGLRDTAAMDEIHCEQVCAGLDVPLALARPVAPPGAGNLQAWAREARYQAAARIASDGDIAAGHTATDQLETVLYRLISSPSRRALLGMAPRRGKLIRPLLSVARAETRAYCEERGLRFRDDPTNDSDAYIRNRIRNEVVPLLRELHPGAEANILSVAEILREEQTVLDGAVEQAGGGSGVTLGELRDMTRGLARLVVQRLAEDALGRPAAGVARRIDDILAMGEDAKLDLPGGVRAVTRSGVLGWEPTPPLVR